MSLAPPAHSPIAAGYRLDRYELICPIAEGGMASVWIARQTGKHGFRKLVAVKTILPKYAAEPTFQRMFIDEARIASRIEHANVAQILDVGEQHGVTYLVMEYVDGDALAKIHRAVRKKDARMPLGVLLRIMAEVCGGLHAAHELRDEAGALLGVVHRDVSPQNVLVTTRGAAKLIDFGVAKARDRLAGETHNDTLKGKVQYMPPEQALGLPIDRRADVWAVGAVLYHLIAGKAPFEADNEVQTLFRVTSGQPPAPLPPEVPAAVREVIRRTLSHSADGRYATAAELQQALEDAIADSRLAATTSAVAAFLAETVGDRADKRKEAIALGLKAADEREKIAALMRSNAEATGAPDSTGEREGLGGLTQAEAIRRPESLAAPETTTSPTGQTLGSAAMELPPLHGKRGRTVAAVAGGVVVVAAAVALLAVRSSSSAPPLPAAASVQPPFTTASALATPTPPEPAASPSDANGPSRPAPTASAAATAPSRLPARWAASTAATGAATARPAATNKHRENYGF